MDQIKQINEDSENDGSFEAGINKFTDLTPEEYKSIMGLIPQDEDLNNDTDTLEDASINAEIQAPSSVDWRDEDAVGPIRNQYACASCYSFSALSAIESLYYI